MKYRHYTRKMKKWDIFIFLIVSTSDKLFSDSFFCWYILDATRHGEWGDHVTLQAAADRVSFQRDTILWVYYNRLQKFYKHTLKIRSSLSNCILKTHQQILPLFAHISLLFLLEWLADSALLQFEAKICLVTSFRDQSYIEILPHNKNPLRGTKPSFYLYALGQVYSFLTVLNPFVVLQRLGSASGAKCITILYTLMEVKNSVSCTQLCF